MLQIITPEKIHLKINYYEREKKGIKEKFY